MWMVAAAFASAPTGRMEGVITSPTDGRGMPNVDVILTLDGLGIDGPAASTPDRPVYEPHLTRTDRTGAFTFEGLAPGLYALDVVSGPDMTGAGTVAGAGKSGAGNGLSAWIHLSPILVVPGATSTQHVVLRPGTPGALHPGALAALPPKT